MTTPATDTLTTKAVAEKLGTDPKTLRVFLRSTSQGVGSGSRYSFTAKDVAQLKAKFTKWTVEREAAKKTKNAESKSG
jgi:ribosomal protein S24E